MRLNVSYLLVHVSGLGDTSLKIYAKNIDMLTYFCTVSYIFEILFIFCTENIENKLQIIISYKKLLKLLLLEIPDYGQFQLFAEIFKNNFQAMQKLSPSLVKAFLNSKYFQEDHKLIILDLIMFKDQIFK